MASRASRDFNQIAKRVVDVATGQIAETPQAKPTGRGKGGNARAAAMSPERRNEVARKAAQARWHKHATAV